MTLFQTRQSLFYQRHSQVPLLVSDDYHLVSLTNDDTSFENSDASLVVLVGLFTGQKLKTLLTWVSLHPDRYLVWIDNRIDAFYSWLHQNESIIDDLIVHPRVVFLYHRSSFLEQTVGEILRKFPLERIHVIPSHPHDFDVSSALQGSYLQKQEIFREILTGHSKFYAHFFAHLARSFHLNLPLKSFRDSMKYPVVICGAGPSLDESFDYLRKIQGRAIIIACGSAHLSLQAQGVIPDIVASIDPNPEQMRRFSAFYHMTVPLWYHSRTHDGVVDYMQGIRHWLGLSSTLSFPQSFLRLPYDGDIDEGSGVAPWVLHLVLTMGAPRIVLLGLDFSFTHNQYYARGVCTDRDNYPKRLSHSHDSNLFWWEAYDGSYHYTQNKWVQEVREIEKLAHEFPQKVYQPFSSGIPFYGVERKHWDHLEHLSVRYFDLANLIYVTLSCLPYEVSQDQVTGSLNLFKEFLVTYKKRLEEAISADFFEQEYLMTLLWIEWEGSNFYDETWKYYHDAWKLCCENDLSQENMTKYCLHKLKELIEIKERLVLQTIENRQRHQLNLNNLSQSKEARPMNQDVYIGNDHEIIIRDYEMGLDIHQQFSPRRLPENLFSLKDNELPGLCLIRSSDATLEEAYWCEGDVIEGECQLFYPNQALKGRMFYLDGQLHGPSTFYSQEGTLLAQSWYLFGKKIGKTYQYYLSGNLYSCQRFQEGQWHGKQLYYYEDGTLKTVMNYEKGWLNGATFLYHPNGLNKREVHFAQGKRNGKERHWNELGVLTLENEYHNDQSCGTARRWFESGVLAEELVYHETSLRYNFKSYNKEGSLMKEGVYDEHNRYTYKEWDDEGSLQKERKGYWNGEKLVLEETQEISSLASL